MLEPKVIYDFGANNGDDLPYYLLKADKVVAVEANPTLCRQIEARFEAEIKAGRLVVENCVLAEGQTNRQVPFYVHKTNDVLSQFPRPEDDKIGNYECISLASESPLSLTERHGAPYYIKVDVEHYDAEILRLIFEAGLRPPFISAESHDVEVFAVLVALGGYKAFKLVDGRSVGDRFIDHPIRSSNGEGTYSFPHHSAGPFGEDIPGGWMAADNFFRLLALEGLGWKDIHATNQVAPDPELLPSVKAYFVKAMADRMPGRARKLARSAVAKAFPEVTRVAAKAR
ncbi:MAG TPA: FkbM family methyltransferase [Acetobacteraceae bacterium]|jgi:FkbM family methyltransferase|nr:FkbM family methyltransferase [Acetobacteraceae bacterium]